MRKKDLINENLKLFDKLQMSERNNFDLKRRLKEKEDEINRLKENIENLNSLKNTSQPMKKLEEKVVARVSVNTEVDYGSEVIGRIVVSAANYSNNLTVGGEMRYKELVNLILGKTEVAKAEILSAVSGDLDFEEKKKKIDLIEANTYEYFESVLAQRT